MGKPEVKTSGRGFIKLSAALTGSALDASLFGSFNGLLWAANPSNKSRSQSES
ncbi:MAG: hypothetical protein NTU44_04460 [Bacteroidetes bacterium]|nr:hypothetical protein [Bacteroidota bacterium]